MNRKVLAAVLCAPFVLLLGLLSWANAPFPPLEDGAAADRVRIHKAKRTLVLLHRGTVLRTFPISLGPHPEGPKTREGDGRTPEGSYVIDSRKADSSFHRALHINYPRPDQTEAAAREGRNPGSLIMIHGLRNGLGWLGRLHRAADWTAGCIAVTNPEIEEIWRVVPDGTPVEILP